MNIMLDRDLSVLYGVETRVLNQAVKINIERFTEDFMFQLTQDEFINLKSQNVISSWGGDRNMPYAFTEQGVAMLSSILKSRQAIQTNIQIIRIFTKMKEMMMAHKEILLKVNQIEKKLTKHVKDFEIIFSALKQLLYQEQQPREKIGFKIKGLK